MSYRGNVNQLEGPPNFGRRGILAGYVYNINPTTFNNSAYWRISIVLF